VMHSVFERIRQVAPTMGTVLITGPSGTGKELVAQAIHQHSSRRERAMVTINCTAIPENVLESELFGHVKGAFTGAWKDKKGLVEAAHESTLFLDEIGDLSPMLQTKLLRLLQEGEYKPVGSVTTRKADLRFIAATNHELKADIEAKRFREDLYYRLNVIRFDLPSLKERREDIPLLCRHFLEKYARLNQKEIRDISPSVVQTLMTLDFPGNVRELENIIERGVIFCRGDILKTNNLFLDTPNKPLFAELNPEITQLPFKEAKDRMLEIFHRQYVEVLLQENNGNVSRAAEKAGIQRQYFHRLMKDAGIEAEEFKQRADS
jgi:DNA-binding NtrC family response regulator